MRAHTVHKLMCTQAVEVSLFPFSCWYNYRFSTKVVMGSACFYAMDRLYLIDAFSSTHRTQVSRLERPPWQHTYSSSVATSLFLFVPGTWLIRLQRRFARRALLETKKKWTRRTHHELILAWRCVLAQTSVCFGLTIRVYMSWSWCNDMRCPSFP